MEALRLQVYQNMVNYRMELSFGYIQSYPLPTPSMIRGMVHSWLGAKEYHPLKISIQGTHSSVVTNMQKVIKFDRDPKARPDNPYRVEVGSSSKTAKHGLMYVDQLVDVSLVLHIAFQDESLNQKLCDITNRITPVLGRNEDIVRIDECAVVTLEVPEEELDLQKNIYIPEKYCKDSNLLGTAYHLPFRYRDLQTGSFTDKRIFEHVDVRYITSNEALEPDYGEEGDLYFDGKFPVFFLEA